MNSPTWQLLTDLQTIRDMLTDSASRIMSSDIQSPSLSRQDLQRALNCVEAVIFEIEEDDSAA